MKRTHIVTLFIIITLLFSNDVIFSQTKLKKWQNHDRTNPCKFDELYNSISILYERELHDEAANPEFLKAIKNILDRYPSTSAIISTNGLVAWYPFNGNANDESGNGNNCIASNCTLVPDRFNNMNSAYSFSGRTNNSRIIGVANPVLSLSQVTLSAWVKINGQGTQGPRIVGVVPTNTSSEKYGLYLNSTPPPRSYAFYTNPGSSSIWSQTQLLNDNKWHHVVTTFDGSTIKLFIDGVLDKTVNKNLSIGQFTSGHVVVIGGGAILGNDRFDGSLDDIRIYNRALDDIEIQVLYHEGGWQ